jgi:hypothetical protein
LARRLFLDEGAKRKIETRASEAEGAQKASCPPAILSANAANHTSNFLFL